VPKAHIAPQAHRFCQRQKHRIIAFARKILLFFRQGKTIRNTDGFLLFGFIVFC